MIDKEIVGDFVDIIGNMEIAINLDSFTEVKKTYKNIMEEVLEWIKYYYSNNNFDIVTHDKSLEIHDLLDEIKWKMLTDKNIGIESLLADNVLIRYEVIIKKINKERGSY